MKRADRLKALGFVTALACSGVVGPALADVWRGRPRAIPADSCVLGEPCGVRGTCWRHPEGHLACVERPPKDALPNWEYGRSLPNCKQDADCTASAGGRCAQDSFPRCGGAAPSYDKFCIYDGCVRDSDCSGANLVCIPAGFAGMEVSTCLPAICRSNADCTKGPDGRCELVGFGCNPPEGSQRIGSRLQCTYSNDMCRLGESCPALPSQQWGVHCAPDPDGHGTRCLEDSPPAP